MGRGSGGRSPPDSICAALQTASAHESPPASAPIASKSSYAQMLSGGLHLRPPDADNIIAIILHEIHVNVTFRLNLTWYNINGNNTVMLWLPFFAKM